MKYLSTLLIIAYTSMLSAQVLKPINAEQAVIKTIQTLFDGMRAGDSTMLRSVLHPSANMQSSFTNKKV